MRVPRTLVPADPNGRRFRVDSDVPQNHPLGHPLAFYWNPVMRGVVEERQTEEQRHGNDTTVPPSSAFHSGPSPDQRVLGWPGPEMTMNFTRRIYECEIRSLGVSPRATMPNPPPPPKVPPTLATGKMGVGGTSRPGPKERSPSLAPRSPPVGRCPRRSPAPDRGLPSRSRRCRRRPADTTISGVRRETMFHSPHTLGVGNLLCLLNSNQISTPRTPKGLLKWVYCLTSFMA